MGKLARAVLPGLRTVQAQVPVYTNYWDDSNRLVLDRLAQPGARDDGHGLWVALGDSTAQGIGAPDPQRGYVGQLAATLVRRTGKSWQVLNLSRSGARTAEVIDAQLPRLEALSVPPDLVTCAIGANDLVGNTPPNDLMANLRVLIRRLPPGAVIGTLPQGLRPERSVLMSDLIRHEAAKRGLRVADIWATTGPPWDGKLASDGFHPGTLGYADWARAFELAIEVI